jgi:hypothetical protein
MTSRMASPYERRTVTGPAGTAPGSGLRAKPVTVETGASGDRVVDDEQLAMPTRTTRPASAISAALFMSV